MTISYRWKLSEETRSHVRRLHPELRRKVRAALGQILQNPHSGKALRQDLEGLRSFPVGRFRIIYRLMARSIDIIAIGPRKDIYAETLRLIRRDKKLNTL